MIPPGLGRTLLDRAFFLQDSVTRVNLGGSRLVAIAWKYCYNFLRSKKTSVLFGLLRDGDVCCFDHRHAHSGSAPAEERIAIAGASLAKPLNDFLDSAHRTW